MPLFYAKYPWMHTIHSMSPDEKYSALKRLKRNNFLTGAESNIELFSAGYLGIGVLQLASAAGGGGIKSSSRITPAKRLPNIKGAVLRLMPRCPGASMHLPTAPTP